MQASKRSLTRSPDDRDNDHPLWGRITGMWSLPKGEITQYLNGTLHKQEADSIRAKNSHGNRVKVWAMIDGQKVAFRSIIELATAIGATGKALSNAKFCARRSGHTTARVFGYTFGWGEPPNPIDK